MNQYRCETCEHRFTPDYWKDGCNRFGKTFMSDDEMRFIFTYGCASHSDYQSERDKVLDKLIKMYQREEHLVGMMERKEFADGQLFEINYILKTLWELRQAGG